MIKRSEGEGKEGLIGGEMKRKDSEMQAEVMLQEKTNSEPTVVFTSDLMTSVSLYRSLKSM